MRNLIITAQLFFAILLTSAVKAQTRIDPWITMAYKELYNRKPSSTEVNIKNYNNGSWNSYDELKGYIRDYVNNKTNNTTTYATSPTAVIGRIKGGKIDGRSVFAIVDGAFVKTINLIGNDGSTLIGLDGSTLIGNDGGTLVGNDGASLIGNDGGTLISNNTSYSLISNIPSLRTMGKYSLQSVSSAKKVKWGKYTIYIK